MPLLFQYLVKLSCSLAVVYLFYQLVLRRLTFYTANRWYLLSYSLLCFFIPFINIAPFIEQNRMSSSGVVRLIPALEIYTGSATTVVQKEAAAPFTIWDGCLMVFAIGVVILLARLVIQLVSYHVMKKHAQLITKSGIPVYQVDKAIIPFSFGQSIFINRSLHNETELTEIIRHEFVHVRQRHTIDIIWTEILCIINWYNPAAWLLRHAVRQNLEFIADNNVIESGLDKREYQYLLLKVIGLPQFRIAASFNFSSLKKRIVMMNKLKSAKAHLVKFLFALPLLVVLLVAFRTENMQKQESQNLNVPKRQTDTVPAPPPPPIAVPPIADTNGLPGDYNAFLKRNPTVKDIHWSERTVVIELKSGRKETYQRNDAKSMAAAIKKWGKLPALPSPPPPPLVAPPPPPPVKETKEPVEETAAIDYIEQLRTQIAQLNDSIQNGRTKEDVTALQANLNERNVLLQKEQKALQTYMQEKQLYLQEKQVAAAEKQNAMLLQLKQRQAALEQDRKASQEYLKKRQQELQKEQKAVQNAKDNRSSFVLSFESEPTTLTAMTLVVNADAMLWNAQEHLLTFSNKTKADKVEVKVNESAEMSPIERSLVLIDGREVTLVKSFANHKSGTYRLVMLEKKDALKKYGEKGKNGAIEIETL